MPRSRLASLSILENRLGAQPRRQAQQSLPLQTPRPSSGFAVAIRPPQALAPAASSSDTSERNRFENVGLWRRRGGRRRSSVGSSRRTLTTCPPPPMEAPMQYKTIVLDLIQQRSTMHALLKASQTLQSSRVVSTEAPLSGRLKQATVPPSLSLHASGLKCGCVQVEAVEDLVVVVARGLDGVAGEVVRVGALEVDRPPAVAVQEGMMAASGRKNRGVLVQDLDIPVLLGVRQEGAADQPDRGLGRLNLVGEQPLRGLCCKPAIVGKLQPRIAIQLGLLSGDRQRQIPDREWGRMEPKASNGSGDLS